MAKKEKTKKAKKQRDEMIQSFLPVQNIRNGIIETVDKRYIKILEIEPINFNLKSAEEQANIISSFASWLKISPAKLQFKIITRKADSDKHLKSILEDLKNEDDIVKDYGKGYAQLLKEVGNREALTRRFFLIFQYEPSSRAESDDYEQIYLQLLKAENTARAYFLQCGNNIIVPKNPDEQAAEILYTFFNKNSCVTDLFENRMNKIVFDRMIYDNKTIGVDDVPEIPINDFFAPRGIDLSHINYFIMDGLYYSVMYISAKGYPTSVYGGWTSMLVNAGEGIDVDIYLNRENRRKTIDKVSRKIRLNKSKAKDKQDTNTDFEELSNAINAGYFIKNGIAANNEDLFYMSIFITVSASTYKELMWRKQQVSDMLRATDIFIRECPFQQEEALKTIMPFLNVSNSLSEKSKRNILTSGAAATFPFTSYEMSDEMGVMLGLNRYNNSLCIIDLFDTNKNKNANLNIIGTSGAGKTFTMQLLALRMRMRGIQCFIIAPIKGHEFRRACNRIGGTYIKIAPSSPNCINVMEIRHTISPEMELIDEMDFNDIDSALAKKIQQLMIFFQLLIPDMTNEEEQMLDEALVKTYADFGITHDNESLYIDRNHNPPIMKKMPVLGDLHNILKQNSLTERIAIILSRFVTGSAQSFNQQTNVDLSNKYIVLDLSELKGKLLPVGMMIALDFVWDKIKTDRTKKKAVFIDEIWQLIGASSNKQAAEFCLTIFKTIRGFGGAAVSATQDLSDFFSLEDGKYGRAIINNSKNKIVLNLEPDEAKYVQDVLKLTPNEVKSITQFERGEALIHSNNNKIPVYITASDEEKRWITTDRSELEAILREKNMNGESA